MYTLYVLASINFKKSYVGYTDNIERRLNDHNSGKSEYTERYKPWKLIYTEEYKSIEEAIKKEKYYKSSAGRKKLKKLFS